MIVTKRKKTNTLNFLMIFKEVKMMIYGKFTIDEKLPSVNEYIDKCRINKNLSNQFKRRVEDSIRIYIAKAKRRGELTEFNDTPCTISFVWHEVKANRDVDNIQFGQKFIIDALKTYGIIKNDGQRYVKQTFHKVVKSDNDKYYVTVELKEYDSDTDIGVF